MGSNSSRQGQCGNGRGLKYAWAVAVMLNNHLSRFPVQNFALPTFLLSTHPLIESLNRRLKKRGVKDLLSLKAKQDARRNKIRRCLMESN